MVLGTWAIGNDLYKTVSFVSDPKKPQDQCKGRMIASPVANRFTSDQLQMGANQAKDGICIAAMRQQEESL